MDQIDLFGWNKPKFEIRNKIRLIELFAGVGAQKKSLEVLGVDHEGYKTCEWSWKSIIAYKAIHHPDDHTDYSAGMGKEELIDKVRGISQDYNQPMSDKALRLKDREWLARIYNAMRANRNPTPDISKLKAEDLEIAERETYTYVLTYSFPCQSLSVAGKQEGMEKGSGTRSGLLWEVERLLLELKSKDELPQVLLMENVPQVCAKAQQKPWSDWLHALEKMGYTNFVKVMNAKDYGIPQSRDRCFMVSILGDWAYSFPRELEPRHNLGMFLDKGKIDEKYFLSQELVDKFVAKYPPSDPHASPSTSPSSTETDLHGETEDGLSG